jgi:hypothetical protein
MVDFMKEREVLDKAESTFKANKYIDIVEFAMDLGINVFGDELGDESSNISYFN